MPKKYGSVTLDKKQIGWLICRECGYRWQATDEELKELAGKNHQVSCLLCRAMNSIKVEQILPKNPQFRLAEAVKVSSPDELRGDNYQNKEALVTHLRCRRSFKVSLMDIRTGDIKCKHCEEAHKHNITDGKPSIQRGKLVEAFDKYPTLEENGRVPVQENDPKLGKVVSNGIRVMEIDEKRDTYTTQCTLCGTEEVRSLSVVKAAKVKSKTLLCSRCSKSLISLEELKRMYLRKVFNCQQIDKIYYGDNNEVLCDLVCMQNKKNTGLAEYIRAINDKNSSNIKTTYGEIDILHTQIGVPLGDVINKRCYCKTCGNELLPKYIRDKLISNMCSNMPNKLTESKVYPKIDVGTLTNSEFYKSVRTKSLCDFCSIQKTCKLAGLDQRNNLSIISTLMDIENSLLGEMLDLTLDYPSMFQFKESDGKNVEVKPDKDLIIIKEAFSGSDGCMHRTCKCIKHGTELTLTDAEIEAFDHTQCFEKNAYMRFFDMQQKFYLKLNQENKK